jgi:antitoxin component of MazEF toxin-antitoxin module
VVNVVVKKWGNSYGIILPIKIVKTQHLDENDVINIEIKKKVRPIEELFGMGKLKKSTQQIKDELRAGWDD